MLRRHQPRHGRARRDRAAWLAPGHAVAGIGCTASLATDRPKRGDHRAFITVCTDTATLTLSLTLDKGARDRAGEEAVVKALLLGAMARLFGISTALPVALLPGDRLTEEPGADGAALLVSAGQMLCVAPDGRLHATAAPPAALLPGAFNPLHHGHRELARVAAELLGQPAAFELSVRNVDKGAIPPEEVRIRLRQFAWLAPVWLTAAPTFAEKARLFPGTAFVVGADTAARLFAPHYYADGETGMAAALDAIRGHGCRFLVACRADGSGQYLDLDGIGVPAAWRDLFQAIPPQRFRVDVSSTQLRQQPAPL